MAGLSSLSSAVSGAYSAERRTRARIFAATANGSPVLSGTAVGTSGRPIPPPIVFQYFPESIDDTKQVNYQASDIPGGSLPVYQWLSSGARVISFTTFFSTDTQLLDPANPENLNVSLIERQDNLVLNGRNVDIRSYVAALRSYTFPYYNVAGDNTKSYLPAEPWSLILEIPHSGIGLAGGLSGGAIDRDRVLCKMLTCDVRYLKFFPTGLPRLASVDLSFGQIGQINNTMSFPSYTPALQNSIFPKSNAPYRGVLPYEPPNSQESR